MNSLKYSVTVILLAVAGCDASPMQEPQASSESSARQAMPKSAHSSQTKSIKGRVSSELYADASKQPGASAPTTPRPGSESQPEAAAAAPAPWSPVR